MRHRKINTQQIKEMINLYITEKMSTKQIANIYMVSPPTIQRHLKVNGVKMRTVSESTRIYNVNEYFFERIDTEEKAYWLGFLYADGCVRDEGRHKYLALGLSSKDEGHIRLFKKHIESDCPIYKVKTKSHYLEGHLVKECDLSKIHINSNKICENLIKLGCLPRKSLILRFPNIEQVPLQLVHHFIRGYFDGDGTIYVSNKITKQFAVKLLGTYDFLSGVNNFFVKMGVKSKRIFKDRQESKAFAWAAGGNRNVINLYNILYENANIYLDRKHQKFIDLLSLGLKNLPDETNKKAKMREFWDESGNRVTIINIELYCRNNKKFKATGLNNVYLGKFRQYKGWTKYVEGEKWNPIKLIRRPTTGKNYNYAHLL
jgi:intein-encoded DNA endonuclease-like protein